jgi:hypothetical protein
VDDPSSERRDEFVEHPNTSPEDLLTLTARLQLTRGYARGYLHANPHMIDQQLDLWSKLKATVTR